MQTQFVITVTEVTYDDENKSSSVQRYQQVLDAIDLGALAALLNRKPRKPRVKKEKGAA